MNELFIGVNNLPEILSKCETVELLKKVKLGDKKAIEKLTKYNIRFVIYEVFSKFNTVQYDKKDLIQIGNIGLIKAIKSFDISKDTTFQTYAKRCIDNEILMFLKKIKKDKVVQSLDVSICYDHEGNKLKLEDIISDDADIMEEYIKNEIYCFIRNFVKELKDEDKKIIMLYFGFYNNKVYKQQEIANIMSISQSQISRKITKIKKLLSSQLQQNGLVDISYNNNLIRKLVK